MKDTLLIIIVSSLLFGGIFLLVKSDDSANTYLENYNTGYQSATNDVANSDREICLDKGGVPIMEFVRVANRKILMLEDCKL